MFRCPNMLTARAIWTLNTFIVILSYDDLSANKNAAQHKTSCSTCVATNALDRDMRTCMQTVMGMTSPDEFTWWYVDLGNIHSVYNIRIHFRNYEQKYVQRQKGRFAGFSLYVSNTTDLHSGYLCYKDGPELPPLDFNTNCLTTGRFVIFYNERLHEVTYPIGYETTAAYTELCEVTVTGCSSSGVYGENCDKVCPDNCQERRCDIANGTCLGCTPGWLGTHCDEACPVGYYGLQCDSKCVGHCKDSEGCNQTSGLCDNGCDDGWTGSNCTKECTMGTYGQDCAHKCSEKCLNEIACNRTTGKCDTGCDFGYTGDLCETGCEIGNFGKGCNNQCSGHCLDKVPCNPTTGHCESGCASGYVEPFCNKTCDGRKYGPKCMQNCSLNCKDELCNNVDGSCICRNGNQGFLDCIESDLEPKAFSNNCDESSFIAGLSVLVIICIVLGSVCLLFIRKHNRLEKKMHSLHYTSIIRTSTQNNNANNSQQYEELRISENGYHNIELRN
nr:multiple epidermal growth factor-like domains protein 10 [Crassostrea gigas]